MGFMSTIVMDIVFYMCFAVLLIAALGYIRSHSQWMCGWTSKKGGHENREWNSEVEVSGVSE